VGFLMREFSAAELLTRIRANDRQFLAELRLIIERIAQRWGLTAQTSLDDVVQDCFLKLIRNLESGKFEARSSFKTYVYAIARNTCIDHYKMAKTIESADGEPATMAGPGDTPEEHVIKIEQRRIASKVLLSLPKECRRLWRAIFFGRRNYRQAAELLGLSEGTVKRKMWECRQKARHMIEQYEK
jgi:RNA polymerase sigma-70 factor (ECF subfamily)